MNAKPDAPEQFTISMVAIEPLGHIGLQLVFRAHSDSTAASGTHGYHAVPPRRRMRGVHDLHLWVPKTCATWADVWQMATGSIWRSMSVGPVLAWPEVG